MEKLLSNQEATARTQTTQAHATTLIDTIWQKVQEELQPDKEKQAELDNRVTVLEKKKKKRPAMRRHS